MKPFCCLFISLFLVFFVSCKDDEIDYGLGEYYEELATLESFSSFRLDNGTLLVANQTLSADNFAVGDRIYLIYSYSNDNTPGGEVRNIDVLSVSKVSLGELQLMKKEEIDKRGDDLIRLESVWVGSNYLNMLFYIEYKSETHSILLACDEDELEKGNIDIYFRHDKNNDSAGAPAKSILSFDLSKVLEQPDGKRKLSVHINSSNYGKKMYTLVY